MIGCCSLFKKSSRKPLNGLLLVLVFTAVTRRCQSDARDSILGLGRARSTSVFCDRGKISQIRVVGNSGCDGGFKLGINIPSFFLNNFFSAVMTDYIYIKRIIKTRFFFFFFTQKCHVTYAKVKLIDL